MARVRTNIEIDEDCVRTIMDRYRLRTKTEAVDLALRRTAGEPMNKEEALAMEGGNRLEHIPDDRTIIGEL